MCAPILSAIQAANAGPAGSYGADPFTERLTGMAAKLFETDVVIYPVATGTAANALALSQISPPFGGIYCHDGAHIVTDECGAPEFYTGGAKLLGLPSQTGKIGPQALSDAVAFAEEMGVHHVRPAAVSVTQATELGTVYGLDELSALTAAAKRHGLHSTHGRRAIRERIGASRLHARGGDLETRHRRSIARRLEERGTVRRGGRLFQSRARRGVRAAPQTSGPSVVEAALSELPAARLSRGRPVAAQRGARRMRWRRGLPGDSAELPFAALLQNVEANEVFVALPEKLIERLEQADFHFYRWPLIEIAEGAAVRLVTSYSTAEADVDDLLREIRNLA